MPVINAEKLNTEIVKAIADFHIMTGQARAELDLSGGVDSAVMLGLLVQALGPKNVTAIFLGIHSNPDAMERARSVAEALSVRFINFDGTLIFNRAVSDMKMAMGVAGYDLVEIEERIKADPTILGSIRSTMRAPWGRAANRMTGGGIRHGTGNECEDSFPRFYQKGGDGEVDTNPIAMLSKGEVYQLALYFGQKLNAESAYKRIINAIPSADLWGCADKHNDEGELYNYLGIKGYPYYSYINPDGTYKTVGLIERVNRWLDSSGKKSLLFGEEITPETERLLLEDAAVAPEFKGMPSDIIRRLLQSARRVERNTRHKLNPNCPMLTTRQQLVSAGALTNTLPL